MAEPLKILVVHNCDNLADARRSTLDFIYSFERHAPEHHYLYHRIMLPVTKEIRTTDWDAVIFDSTACGIVTLRPRERFARIRDNWAFLRGSPSVKLVFPQDDASHGAIMDLWFNWMEVDALYTVRPEYTDLIYPITKKRAEVISTLAGFLDKTLIEEASKVRKPFEKRRWVVGQRVTQYPAWGGRFARRKGEAALRMKRECDQRGIRNNISTSPADVLHGAEWTKFLGDTQFVVGAEGGHGIWDPYGTIQDATNAFTAANPAASFEETETACFLGLDGVQDFPGFAPRILEAALAGCAQVLVKGHYRGLIKPNLHYIPLAEDYSNFNDVFDAMKNTAQVAAMVDATRRDLVENTRFHYGSFANDVLTHIGEMRASKRRRMERPSSASPEGSWSAFQLAHHESLRGELAFSGIEQERLAEPYLTAWVQRELGGQVTDLAQREKLSLPNAAAPSRVKPGPRPVETVTAEQQTRDTALLRALEMIRAVDAATDALVLLATSVNSDGARDRSTTLHAASNRQDLLRLGTNLLVEIDGVAEALPQLASAFNTGKGRGENTPLHAPLHRQELLLLGTNLLVEIGDVADALPQLASALNADLGRSRNTALREPSHRQELLLLGTNLLAAINGVADVLPQLALNLSADPQSADKLREHALGERDLLVKQSLRVLDAMEATSELLIHASESTGSMLGLLDPLRDISEAERHQMLGLAINILEFIERTDEAVTTLGNRISADSERIRATLRFLSQASASSRPNERSAELYKLYLLSSLGLQRPIEVDSPPTQQKSPEDIFSLLIAQSEALRDPATADIVHRVLETATSSKYRGPVMRLIAKASVENAKSQIARLVASRLD
jgi:hypothetical protein